MKRYLRSYCDYQQSNWIEWLSMIEYALNAIISAFTEISAFMTNYDFESRMSFNSINSSESARERIMQFKEINIAEKM
jgi:hypothetical protein